MNSSISGKADTSARPLATKILKDRPADVHDRCAYVPSQPASPADDVCLPAAAQTHYGSPREVAGGPATNDILKCRLKPISNSDYGVLGLTADQLARLKAVFPKGVCDWTKRGVGQQSVTAWQTYTDGQGHVVYGGHAMGPAPRSTP